VRTPVGAICRRPRLHPERHEGVRGGRGRSELCPLTVKVSEGTRRGPHRRADRPCGGPLGGLGTSRHGLGDGRVGSRCRRRETGWGRRRWRGRRRGLGGCRCLGGSGRRYWCCARRRRARLATLVQLQNCQGRQEAEQGGHHEDGHAGKPRIARHSRQVVSAAEHATAREKTAAGGPTAEQACESGKLALAGVAGSRRKLVGGFVGDGLGH